MENYTSFIVVKLAVQSFPDKFYAAGVRETSINEPGLSIVDCLSGPYHSGFVASQDVAGFEYRLRRGLEIVSGVQSKK